MSEGIDWELLNERVKEGIKTEPKLVTLRRKLLELGGIEIVPREEPDLIELIEFGEVFDLPVTQRVMKARECHLNALKVASGDLDRYVLCTGWVLHSDGLWRQHSWVYDCEEKCIMETTPTVFSIYFGIEMEIQLPTKRRECLLTALVVVALLVTGLLVGSIICESVTVILALMVIVLISGKR